MPKPKLRNRRIQTNYIFGYHSQKEAPSQDEMLHRIIMSEMGEEFTMDLEMCLEELEDAESEWLVSPLTWLRRLEDADRRVPWLQFLYRLNESTTTDPQVDKCGLEDFNSEFDLYVRKLAERLEELVVAAVVPRWLRLTALKLRRWREQKRRQWLKAWHDMWWYDHRSPKSLAQGLEEFYPAKRKKGSQPNDARFPELDGLPNTFTCTECICFKMGSVENLHSLHAYAGRWAPRRNTMKNNMNSTRKNGRKKTSGNCCSLQRFENKRTTQYSVCQHLETPLHNPDGFDQFCKCIFCKNKMCASAKGVLHHMSEHHPKLDIIRDDLIDLYELGEWRPPLWYVSWLDTVD
jgi:hypothetical protein